MFLCKIQLLMRGVSICKLNTCKLKCKTTKNCKTISNSLQISWLGNCGLSVSHLWNRNMNSHFDPGRLFLAIIYWYMHMKYEQQFQILCGLVMVKIFDKKDVSWFYRANKAVLLRFHGVIGLWVKSLASRSPYIPDNTEMPNWCIGQELRGNT